MQSRVLPTMRGTLFLFSFLISISATALETDQFTLPETPLEDVGPMLEGWIRSDLAATLVTLHPGATEDQIRNYFFKRASRCEMGTRRLPISFVGGFCFVFFLENHLRQLAVAAPKIRWSYFPKDSIYVPGATPGMLSKTYENGSRFHALSSTINVFGIYMGTDKPSHFIKLGRDYYNRYRKHLMTGLDEASAITRTIEEMGVRSESGYLGFTVSGNYANADLASNFAGFWFYRNLFEDIQWNGKIKKAILVRNKRTGLWEIKATEILSHFFSEHMNEALNPGTYITGTLTNNLFKNIARRCTRWNQLNPEASFWPSFRKTSRSLRTLNGWDYGWRRPLGLTPEFDKFCTES